MKSKTLIAIVAGAALVAGGGIVAVVSRSRSKETEISVSSNGFKTQAPVLSTGKKAYVLSNGLKIRNPITVSPYSFVREKGQVIYFKNSHGESRAIYDPENGTPYQVDFDTQEGRFVKYDPVLCE